MGCARATKDCPIHRDWHTITGECFNTGKPSCHVKEHNCGLCIVQTVTTMKQRQLVLPAPPRTQYVGVTTTRHWDGGIHGEGQ